MAGTAEAVGGRGADEDFVMTERGAQCADSTEVVAEGFAGLMVDGVVLLAKHKVGHQQPAGVQTGQLSGEAVAGDGAGAFHIVGAAAVKVIDDDIVAGAVAVEKIEGIVLNHFNAEAVDFHVCAGEADHIGIDFDGGHPAFGQEIPELAEDGAAAEAQKQHPPWIARMTEGRGGEGIPGVAGEQQVRVPGGVGGAGDIKIDPAVVLFDDIDGVPR